MSSDQPKRSIRLPSSDFSGRRIPVTSLESSTWYRIHFQRHDPLYFSANPAHRFSHPDCEDEWLYLGAEFQTCVFERLGDRLFDSDGFLERSVWTQLRYSRVQIPTVDVCDLSDTKTRSACRVDLASLEHPDLEISHAWGLAVANHPAGFQGIVYRSRFTSWKCLALMNRENLGALLKSSSLGFGDFPGYSPAAAFLDDHQIALV